METDLTVRQARSILTDRNHDAYGTTRLYGIIADGPSAGQIVGIKSEYHLDRDTYSRVYAKTNNGMVPVLKA